MELTWEIPLLIAAGFAAGFINTMAGGGSLITLSTLIFIGLPADIANGTNRIAIMFQTATAVGGFKSKGVTTFPYSIYFGITALVGAILGAQLATDIRGDLFDRILAIIMIMVVLIVVFKPKMATSEAIERLSGKHLAISIIVFFFIGIYGGFINVGIGFFMMLLLSRFNKLSLVKSNATKVTVAFIYTIAAVVVFALNDKIEYLIGIIMAVGNSLGAWFASRWSVKKGDGVIKVFLLIMVIAISIKLWFF
ncbi:sulfite exporter TauE/SafE family protein [Spongiivirga citrea]|uniref:Probable membrane transporter protein n=1 Tax=Spongiivirga citrea TaxID=1481457 RepID=A0A6M0CFV4_9FLAO|nr:sulfite exporter TauE/SafE family protein [Spongiivirga citrea]NER16766.1 TSUP family transporter [Spongiivirga citrea]